MQAVHSFPADSEIVVSAENNYYMAWQTKLFCYSARTNLGISPTVVVHETGCPLVHDFLELAERGINVLTAPSFAVTPGGRRCPTRNTMGTLLIAADACRARTVLVCEPDMIFRGHLAYLDTFAAEFYEYIDYTSDLAAALIQAASLKGDLARLNSNYRIGVPYLVPRSKAGRLARTWLEMMDVYPTPSWIESMYAFGVAARVQGLVPEVTYQMVTNYNSLCRATVPLIHYCYGDSLWDKRRFDKPGSMRWPRRGMHHFLPQGSVIAELFKQMEDMEGYYAEAAE